MERRILVRFCAHFPWFASFCMFHSISASAPQRLPSFISFPFHSFFPSIFPLSFLFRSFCAYSLCVSCNTFPPSISISSPSYRPPFISRTPPSTAVSTLPILFSKRCLACSLCSSNSRQNIHKSFNFFCSKLIWSEFSFATFDFVFSYLESITSNLGDTE